MYYYDNPKGMIPTWLINWGAKVKMQWNPYYNCVDLNVWVKYSDVTTSSSSGP